MSLNFHTVHRKSFAVHELPQIFACNQAFDLFDTLPLEGDPHEAPPARPPPGWKERFTARQKVAACLSPHAGLAPKVRPEDRKCF